MFTVLTDNTTDYMHSLITLSYYMYLYNNFLSGTSIPHSPAKLSRLPFLLLQFIFGSNLWSYTLHHTMQRQGRFPDTHFDSHADLYLTGEEASCKHHFLVQSFLLNSELHNHLLTYGDASSLSGLELMPFCLAVSLSLLKSAASTY